ncbi:MAG: transketolase, partial [Deltaproteobacteria bacterium]
TDGYIVSYGEMLYRCLDAVEQLRAEGHNIGLINKPTLNMVDEEMVVRTGKAPFVLVVESQNSKTGLGMRYGTQLLERGLTPKYGALGTSRPGHGGIAEQLPHQGLDVSDIKKKIIAMKG